MPARESRIWAGRPSLRPLLMNPLYVVCWAGVVYLVHLRLDGIPLPFRIVLPGGYDPRLVAAVALGAPLLWWPLTVMTTRYELTTQRLIVARGILSRTLDEIELYRIRDVRLTKGFLQRIIGLGTVHVGSSDGTGTLVLPSITGSTRVREAIRDVAEESKRTRNLTIST